MAFDDIEGFPNPVVSKPNRTWPVLLVLAIATLGASIYCGSAFGDSCRELACLGGIAFYAAGAAAGVACIISFVGWSDARSEPRTGRIALYWIMIALAWFMLLANWPG
jgi:hypothetical protein